MRDRLLNLGIGTLLLAGFHLAAGQSTTAAGGDALAPASAPAVQVQASDAMATAPVVAPVVQQLLNFRDSEVKFALPDLMNTLRDRRHEGWVLAAYPDPKTGRPLIGAGVSLDLPEREHPQPDPLNPHSFIEPSSAELWQAAGLAPDRLQSILQQYNDQLAHWSKKRFRKNIRTLPPEITDQEATALLRVSIIQAILNARAYCRNFDQLSAAQQMGLTQLVYQMGVNLEEFSKFLNVINDGSREAATDDTAGGSDDTNWRTAQQSLMQSQWARLYRTRAVAVIAMLDPAYASDPALAERHIAAVLRPAVLHRHRHGRRASLRAAAWSRNRGGRTGRRRSGRAQHRNHSAARARRKV